MHEFKPPSSDRLKDLLKSARSNHSTRTSSSKRAKTTNVTVTLRWYNYNKDKCKFTLVKAIKGGGKRTLVCCRHDHIKFVKDKAESIFFPSGRNKSGQFINMFDAFAADFSLNEIRNETITIQEYIEKHSLSTVVINFMTKELSVIEKMKSHPDRFCSSSDDDFEIPIKKSEKLIGRSEDRQALIAEQDKAFEESVRIDKGKMQEKVYSFLLNTTIYFSFTLKFLHFLAKNLTVHHHHHFQF